MPKNYKIYYPYMINKKMTSDRTTFLQILHLRSVKNQKNISKKIKSKLNVLSVENTVAGKEQIKMEKVKWKNTNKLINVKKIEKKKKNHKYSHKLYIQSKFRKIKITKFSSQINKVRKNVHIAKLILQI